jgi:hypothetical protein
MTSPLTQMADTRPVSEIRVSTATHVWVLLAVYLLAHWELWSRISAPTYGWRPTDLAGIAVNY